MSENLIFYCVLEVDLEPTEVITYYKSNVFSGRSLGIDQHYYEIIRLDIKNGMIKSLSIITITLFFGCQSFEVPERKIVELNEYLGSIQIPITAAYDTLLIWDDRTDYHCGLKHMRRFASKKYMPIKESGFTHSIVPDSVYQITIYIHPNGCEQVIAEKLNSLEFYKEQLKQTGTYRFIEQKKLRLDDKPAVLFAFELGKYLGERQDVFWEVRGQQNLELYIEHKNQIITIKFECSGVKCQNYIENCKKMIQKIEFVQ